jgi:hypothetical protein
VPLKPNLTIALTSGSGSTPNAAERERGGDRLEGGGGDRNADHALLFMGAVAVFGRKPSWVIEFVRGKILARTKIGSNLGSTTRLANGA